MYELTQYWHAGEPPEPIVELLATFPRHCPRLRQTVFDESTADAFIAAHFSAREVAAFRACALPTSQADYLRYCAGYILGGFCLDADVRCRGDVCELIDGAERGIVFGQTRPLPDWIERAFGWPYSVGRYRALVNGAYGFLRARDPLMGLAVEVATANVESRLGEGVKGVWLTTGPGVFTSIYLLHRLGSLDGFLDYTKDTALEPGAALFCEVVEDPARADSALSGLDIAPVEELEAGLLQHVGIPRPGGGVRHWSGSESGIFR